MTLKLRRVPHGTRGLKYQSIITRFIGRMSRPAWDAWIEMLFAGETGLTMESRPAWDAWIEILMER